MVLFNFQDIGTDWSPAILDNQIEADFIRQVQRGFGDNTRSYFLGGTTNAGINTIFDLNSYFTNNSGNQNLTIYLCKDYWQRLGDPCHRALN